MATGARIIVFALGLASVFISSIADGQHVAFGYIEGAIGPSNWGKLSPDWKVCNEGKQQSPIDIDIDKAEVDESLGTLTRRYVDAKASLVNTGYNIQLRYEESVGTVLVDGKNYSLQQLHWHAPSEHTLKGERFPLELHLVHKTKDNQVAVVAILYQLGNSDPFLNQFMDKLKVLAQKKCSDKEEAEIPFGIVVNRAVRRATRKYFRYVGSFTTPPCTENVVWTILGKVRELTQEQATALQAPLSQEYRKNSRPVQPLNGRTVKLFIATDEKKENAKMVHF